MSGKKVKNLSNDDSSFKKAKLAEEDGSKSKKPSNRAGDNLRQMFLPGNKDDLNEKDAIYALNFYDKVEEIFRDADKKEEFRNFLKILKSFDPQNDRVTDLYFKMEDLFMPDHPDLANMFLTFLLPSEASQIGKFFDHFMLTNMANFINRVNLYFMKQPAQIKKIFACLNELSTDVDVNMDKIKTKILPLLKGNKFLTEWFLQIFPTERPPETLISEYETIDLKQSDLNPNPEEVYESISCKDLIEDSPDNNPCQIKYINGRLFYGTKILLPAKVSFLAKPVLPDNNLEEVKSPDRRIIENSNFCVHAVREFAERKLKSVVDNNQEFTSIENDIDKEDEVNFPKYILCDDQTFKSHAIRLNPSLYSRNTYHHSDTTQKSKLFDSDKDGKMSPKKHTKIGVQSKERRKSPKKCLPKSPGKSMINSQPTSLMASTSQAVLTAKKLKSIVEDSSNDDSNRNKFKRKQQKTQPKKITSTTTIAGQESDIVSKPDLESEISPLIAAEPDKPLIWTRDEDKIILEEVQVGFINEEALISKLANLLPNRTTLEIVQRHRFLMDVLTQLQNKA